ncbi:hypothetical protein OIU78_029689 [Salix suchowensis]|uniref:Uncharacterized protein n=1 Tax=Salix koriyanagi TaxID=2511006 RepID=A0A9Q0SSJ6_9ROSI|nr:hypothetical protein OIU78_029689 [Salix suchowensis]KAJ6687858.1 hypothetical protein OIU74_016539 [Salix koriyanagi]
MANQLRETHKEKQRRSLVWATDVVEHRRIMDDIHLQAAPSQAELLYKREVEDLYRLRTSMAMSVRPGNYNDASKKEARSAVNLLIFFYEPALGGMLSVAADAWNSTICCRKMRSALVI